MYKTFKFAITQDEFNETFSVTNRSDITQTVRSIKTCLFKGFQLRIVTSIKRYVLVTKNIKGFDTKK